MNIRVDLNYPIKDGTEVVFRSPVDCSQVTGLKVYYPENGVTVSKEFAFADAHGNNVGDIDHLFAENVVVKVILDVTTGMAFVQNADTNAYLERRIDGVDLTLPKDLTPEQKATVLENTGAARSDGAHGLRLGEDYNLEMDVSTIVDIQPDWPEYEPGGNPRAGRIRLSQPHWSRPEWDVPVVIGHVEDGVKDDDAATVGQLNAATEKYVIPLVYDSTADAQYRYSIDPEFNFNWDEMVAAIQKGVPVFCLSEMNDSGGVTKFTLAALEEQGGYANFSCLEMHSSNYMTHSLSVYPGGYVTYKRVLPDATLSLFSTPADAGAVGRRFKAVEDALAEKESTANRVTTIDENSDDEHYPSAKAVYDQVAKQGFVKLAETILTEDAVEIVWTQTQDGKPLSDYKDFFIYWTGKFTADVGANNSTNSRFQCRGNGGIMYFCCQFPAKNSTANRAGWFYIEEITNDGNFALWKSQFPNAFLNTANGANIDYKVQGLPEACQTTVTDICCITNPAHTTLQKLHLGNTPESTSIFAAGTKAILYGRAR